MQESFYFYDLETSGLNARTDRIMQFAGMRTDLNFRPMGEPTNLLIKIDNDTLPAPEAILVTGITPQQTESEGISERDFCKFVVEEISTPGTTIMGYNSVRFDDEFMRCILWRNFHDPYEWQWKDARSRWDLLDVVRITRALRPEGINWPMTDDGKPTNRLELITKANNISHEHAHDALSDVEALIAVTKLIKQHQPQLFDYLYRHRGKREISEFLQKPQPFVYTSGRYGTENCHTTVVYPIAKLEHGCSLVYDLRYNLDELLAEEQAAIKNDGFDPENPNPTNKPYRECKPYEKRYFPIVKKLQYNHCPAIAPLGVLAKEDGWKKIDLTEEQIRKNLEALYRHPDFIKRMIDRPDGEYEKSAEAEARLYEAFLGNEDKKLCSVVRANGAEELADFHPPFRDKRLPELLVHYKGRNFPETLNKVEQNTWETYRQKRLELQAPQFLAAMQNAEKDLAEGKPFRDKPIKDCKYLLEELMLWYQSLSQ